jgi:formylglycine-generating enzyme required for sulfatase activity
MSEQSIFLAALDISDPTERAAYVTAACAGNGALQKEVESLLAAHERPGAFLDEPALAQMSGGGTGETRTEVTGGDRDSAETRAPDSSAGARTEYDAIPFLNPPTRAGSLGRLAHYEVEEVLGCGGFGMVLRAFDDRLHRVVAIKVMAPQLAASGAARARFGREGRSAAAVRDDHVVDVHEVSADDEPIPYLVMEFVAGQTLQNKIDRAGPLPVEEVLRIGSQVARGLAAAHATGLIHRDIKPANILLENGVERVKITDFGLARAADDASISQSGVVAGTPQYMSPEQAKGEPVDHRSDLFSLGSVLYAMCTGRPPFRAETTLAVLKRVCEDDPRPVREVNAAVPQWLADVVAKLHAKKPDERFRSANEVADRLARYLTELQMTGAVAPEPAAQPVAPAPAARPRRRRWKWGVALVPAAVALGALLFTPAAARHFGDRAEVELVSDPEVLGFEMLSGVTSDESDPQVVEGGSHSTIRCSPGAYRIEAKCKPGRAVDRWELTAHGPFTSRTQERAGESLLLSVSRGDRLTVRPILRDAPAPSPDKDGWVQLFNGRDLSGWKTHKDQPGDWNVEGGAIVGRAPRSHLYTDRGDYENFHIRAEVRINNGGNSGLYFRSSFGPEFDVVRVAPGGPPPGAATERKMRLPHGYEADINLDNPFTKTGSLWSLGPATIAVPVKEATITPDTWFTLEVIARGNRIVTRVDGRTVLDWVDGQKRHTKGHFALQVFHANTVVEFRKIEVKELPPSSAAPPLAVAPFDAAKAKELQDAWSRHLGVPAEYENTLGMKFRLIPPGEFTMGSGKEEIDWLLENLREFKQAPDWLQDTVRSEGPARRVTIREPFHLGVHEVTVGEFREFVRATKYKTEAEKSGGRVWSIEKGGWEQKPEYVWDNPALSRSDAHPVFQVTLADAGAFCAWLSEKEGLRYAVPTEEQWECAARAGTTTRWPFGDDPEAVKKYGWTMPHSDGSPRPVGRLAANPFGLFDMCGNAGEITTDAQGRLVDRGGTFGDSVWRARPAWREVKVAPWDGPTSGRGFRVAIVGDLKAKAPPAPAVAPFDAAKAKGHQDAWAKYLDVPVEFENTLGMKFRLIPPGEFTMGTPRAELDAIVERAREEKFPEYELARLRKEGVPRPVRLTRPYYAGAFEVTWGQFEQFVRATDYKTELEATGLGGFSNFEGKWVQRPEHVWRTPGEWKPDPNEPVVHITPRDAEAFCAWLTQLEGRRYALFTEAQWEFACRAGTTGATYATGGQTLADLAWTREQCGDLKTAPQTHRPRVVGQKRPNAFGLHDMLGNAWEYVSDWYAPGPGTAELQIDPTGPPTGTGRVLRGGCWYRPGDSLARSATRWTGRLEAFGDCGVGFRVAIVGDLEPKPQRAPGPP